MSSLQDTLCNSFNLAVKTKNARCNVKEKMYYLFSNNVYI